MKVIFLDIDGVLNHMDWYNDDRNPGNINGEEGDLDPICVERVKRICDETGAKVVISSDWKNQSGTIGRLGGVGLPKEYIIDKTPTISDFVKHTRGDEINLWLLDHPYFTNYVILDDRTDFDENQRPHFIHIDRQHGLTEDDTDIAIMTLQHH